MFVNNKTNICVSSISPSVPVYPVIGIPDTYLLIPETPRAKRSIESEPNEMLSSQEYIVNRDYNSKDVQEIFNSLITQEQLDINRRLFNMSYAWGTIRYLAPKNNVLTSFDLGHDVQVMDLFNETYPVEGNQNFIHLIDQSIRRDKSNYCLTLKPYLYVTLEPCSRTTSRWIFDPVNRQLIEERTLHCLTVHPSLKHVELMSCDKGHVRATQLWEFEYKNVNPEIVELNPPLTVEDLEYVQKEFKETATTVYLPERINETISWGKFYNGKKSDDWCLFNSAFILEPLLVSKCHPTDPFQNFEYLQDGTIRTQNSELCIHANNTNTMLFACNSRSQKFIKAKNSAQFIEQRSRKCLQAFRGKLVLGKCSEQKASQQWQFEYTNQALKEINNEPPIAKLISMSLLNADYNPPTIMRRAVNDAFRPTPLIPPVATSDHPITAPKEQWPLINATIQHLLYEVDKVKQSIQQHKLNHSVAVSSLELEIRQLRILLGKTSEESLSQLIRDVEKIQKEIDIQRLTNSIKKLEDRIFNTTSTLDKVTDKTIANLPDDVKRMIETLHNQYKQEILVAQENKLADEIRQVYCQVSALERNQAIILAQGNGLLAAAALDLPTCSRLKGFGQTLLLEQCKEHWTNITAVETTCGFQPYFFYDHRNYTIGIDGWSIHPFSDCFWQTHLININGRPYMWIANSNNGDWIEQKPNLHSTNLELIAEFKEVPLNDYDFTLRAHPAHECSDLEQLNILNDLMGRIQETNSNSFSTVVQSEKQFNNIQHVFSWIDTLKIMTLCVIGFIFFLICLRIFIALNPFPKLIQKVNSKTTKRKSKKKDYMKNAIELATTKPILSEQTLSGARPNALPTESIGHSHTHCTYVVGKGLVWEDLCPCDEE